MRGAAISEKRGMKDLEKLAIPRNERKCLTVSGAGHSTTVAMLDSVGAQPLADILNPKNSTSVQKSSDLAPLTKSSFVRSVSSTASNFSMCSTGSSDSVKIEMSSV